jgi:hypothetical protein
MCLISLACSTCPAKPSNHKVPVPLFFFGSRLMEILVLEKLAVGETVEKVLDAHPRLTVNALREVLSFAA